MGHCIDIQGRALCTGSCNSCWWSRPGFEQSLAPVGVASAFLNLLFAMTIALVHLKDHCRQCDKLSMHLRQSLQGRGSIDIDGLMQQSQSQRELNTQVNLMWKRQLGERLLHCGSLHCFMYCVAASLTLCCLSSTPQLHESCFSAKMLDKVHLCGYMYLMTHVNQPRACSQHESDTCMSTFLCEVHCKHSYQSW